jgi:hypothetical protein
VSIVDDAIALLEQKTNSLRRSELTQAMESVGFIVQKCKKGGHRKVKHPRLAGFFGTRFDGGHGTDDQVKACYVRNMITVLKLYKDDLERLPLGAPR